MEPRSDTQEPLHSHLPPANRLLAGTIALAVAAGAGIAGASIFNHVVLDDALPDLNAIREATINNWLSVTMSFAAGSMALLAAAAGPAGRRLLAGLGAAILVLSIDDGIELHERVGENIGINHIETAIFAPLYFGVVLAILALSIQQAPRLAWTLRAGVVALFCAVAVELPSSLTRDLEADGTTWPQAARVAVEEGLEVAGWTLLAGALLTLFCLRLLSEARQQPARTGAAAKPSPPPPARSDAATGARTARRRASP